ncbi:MAG TPA: hypothetical protein VK005_02565 [Acholeplasma sp.]|nr:hypothetical protein [Acholeplasma sp.]
MKKLYVSIIALLSVFILASCQEQDTRPVLTYAAWNLGTVEDNNIERRLIQAYQDAHPEIRIEIIARPTTVNEDGSETDVSWVEFFGARAAIGKLPDVFQVADVTNWIIQGWLEDVSDLAEEDPDLALVPDDIVNSARFGDYLFALPQAMFYYGFFIDRTVYQEINQYRDVTYGMTFTELMQAAQKNYRLDLEVGGTGIAGIDGVSAFIEWLPAQYDASLDWFTFNSETGYHLNSTAFQNAVNEQKKYYTPDAATNYRYVLNALPDEDRLVQYGTTDPWSQGKQSIKWAPSYNLRDWIGATNNPASPLYQHDIDFIGTPRVGDNHRIPVIMDYIAVGRGTQMREEAYDFARYMGYGVEGYKKRLEIAEENPSVGAINFAPIAQDQELIDAYFALYPNMTEYRKIVEEHDSFISESLWKTTPGYWLSRANGAYDETQGIGEVINKVIQGELQLADVVNGLQTAANNHWTTAKQELDAALLKFAQENS